MFGGGPAMKVQRALAKDFGRGFGPVNRGAGGASSVAAPALGESRATGTTLPDEIRNKMNVRARPVQPGGRAPTLSRQHSGVDYESPFYVPNKVQPRYSPQESEDILNRTRGVVKGDLPITTPMLATDAEVLARAQAAIGGTGTRGAGPTPRTGTGTTANPSAAETAGTEGIGGGGPEGPGAPPPGGGGFWSSAWGKVPPGAQDWIKKYQTPLAAAGGGLGGAGITQGLNSYADSRRRNELENLGFFPRLMLAAQLAADPRGFNNRIGL
jgi:hypothetical protein